MKRLKNILCVIDAENPCKSTMGRAASLAERHAAKLAVVDVIPGGLMDGVRSASGVDAVNMEAALTADRMEKLEKFTASSGRGLHIEHRVLVGTLFLEIIRAVLRNGYDLVIKRAETPGFIERLFGSDDMHLLRKCPCPVWIMKPEDKDRYRCVLAAVDIDLERIGAPEPGLNREILELASMIALSDTAEMHFVHAWDAPGELTLRTWSSKPDEAAFGYVDAERRRHKTGMDALREQLQTMVGESLFARLSPRFHLDRGVAREVVPESAKRLKADLVVMGTVARTGVSGLFIGNTAESVLEQLRCSVLAIKPPGFVSPVRE